MVCVSNKTIFTIYVFESSQSGLVQAGVQLHCSSPSSLESDKGVVLLWCEMGAFHCGQILSSFLSQYFTSNSWSKINFLNNNENPMLSVQQSVLYVKEQPDQVMVVTLVETMEQAPDSNKGRAGLLVTLRRARSLVSSSWDQSVAQSHRCSSASLPVWKLKTSWASPSRHHQRCCSFDVGQKYLVNFDVSISCAVTDGDIDAVSW